MGLQVMFQTNKSYQMKKKKKDDRRRDNCFFKFKYKVAEIEECGDVQLN